MLADPRYCYPLTISDFATRYLFSCEALATTQETYAFAIFERVFKEFGLPKAIRTDNGVPFASPHALFGFEQACRRWLRQASSAAWRAAQRCAGGSAAAYGRSAGAEEVATCVRRSV